MQREAIFLDKDNTLGDWFNSGLYSRAKEFLLSQKERERGLYVVTRSHNGKSHLNEIESILDGYFDIKQLDSYPKSYKNPYLRCVSHSKDLYLVKSLIQPNNPDSLRTVMVGDNADAMGYVSDPTPLIVISDSVRAGNWSLVSTPLEFLFVDKTKYPWQIYDQLWIDKNNNNQVNIDGTTYSLAKETEISRIIFCPK
jgi:hypothetical protein